MRAVNADYILEELDIVAPYEDTVKTDTVKKIVEKAPTVTGIEWTPLSDDNDIPEDVLLLVSFANAAGVMTGYYKDGYFLSPGNESFRRYGLIANAWCVAPQSYEG